METLQKIGKFEAIGLLVMIVVDQIVLNLASYLVSSCGSSTWINIIYVSILTIFFCIIINKLFKPFNSSDILDVSNFLGGNFLKIFVGILYILFFIFIAGISLRHISSSIKSIYFEDTPLIYIMLFFIIPAAITCKLRY